MDGWVFAKTLGVLIVVALGLTGLGFRIAWGMTSTAGFHAVMNLLLMPMWLLSGAFFPLTGVPAWLEWVMRVNPMTYAMATLRAALGMGVPSADGLPGQTTCAVVTLGFAVGTVVWSTLEVGRRRA